MRERAALGGEHLEHLLMDGKEMTPEQLAAENIRSYGVKLNDQQFLMMTICDDRVGDFGGSIKFMFNKSRK